MESRPGLNVRQKALISRMQTKAALVVSHNFTSCAARVLSLLGEFLEWWAGVCGAGEWPKFWWLTAARQWWGSLNPAAENWLDREDWP